MRLWSAPHNAVAAAASQPPPRTAFTADTVREAVVDVAWSPSVSTLFASVSRDGRVQLWDARKVAPVLEHVSRVDTAQWEQYREDVRAARAKVDAAVAAAARRRRRALLGMDSDDEDDEEAVLGAAFGRRRKSTAGSDAGGGGGDDLSGGEGDEDDGGHLHSDSKAGGTLPSVSRSASISHHKSSAADLREGSKAGGAGGGGGGKGGKGRNRLRSIASDASESSLPGIAPTPPPKSLSSVLFAGNSSILVVGDATGRVDVFRIEGLDDLLVDGAPSDAGDPAASAAVAGFSGEDADQGAGAGDSEAYLAQISALEAVVTAMVSNGGAGAGAGGKGATKEAAAGEAL